MWDIDNGTPYAADANWIRDRKGVHHWLVAVRATFEILPTGDVALADEQPPPCLEPQYRGDPATTSLVIDADLLADKPETDVVLDASAYAPRGRAADRVEVSLHIESLVKTLVVHGPRVYQPSPLGPRPSASRSFTIQPIQYEWAFGGSDLRDPDLDNQRIDERNPVGKGVVRNERDLYDQPAHVVEYPPSSSQRGPAGFGPIASHWLPRRLRAGTYDMEWERARKPLLPDDYDPSFSLSAPDDQRVGRHLRGGEPVLLKNMSTEGTLRFELPGVALLLETNFEHRSVEHSAVLATVFIAPGERRLSMVWQSSLRVPLYETESLDFTYIRETGSPI
jgi:hypothetical protein